jgi:hypothetical protein
VLLIKAPARIIEFDPLVAAVDMNSKMKIPATK